ncbi:uncharacterized protein HaLaN_07328 [Haematococcus lacustris]|uniref:Uncharacterized protein n=1 Tax=Haematococcus lacustris TaxID=44745 RepID=A0A699Z8B0_HAELA|nr:uncharacterized protein HaLaN_07328 [Haematococcus lacustris]
MPEAAQDNWAAGLSDARSVTTGDNGAKRPMRLVIWHECQSLGCAATYDCELCRHNPARRCTEHFRAKYLIRDSARAKCGGAVRVRVEVAGCDAETSTSPNLPCGTQVEVIVLKGGAEYEHLARGVGSPQPGLEEILSLAVHYDRALIRRDDSSDAPHRITVALEKNEYGNVLGCSLADLHFTTSSEVLLGGKAPVIRLLLLAVDRLGMPLPNVEYAVSEPFTVSTRRMKQAMKSDVPSLGDPVTKLLNVGRATASRLQDLSQLAVAEGLPEELSSITTVEAFQQLLDRVQANPVMEIMASPHPASRHIPPVEPVPGLSVQTTCRQLAVMGKESRAAAVARPSSLTPRYNRSSSEQSTSSRCTSSNSSLTSEC